MKLCPRCKISKPLTKFYKDKSRKDGLSFYCSLCKKDIRQKYDKSPKGKISKKRYRHSEQGKHVEKKYWLRKKYSMSMEEHKQMYADQDGKCMLCDKQIAYKDVQTDHNHSTGVVRGLLCWSCNTKLGWFENRSERILKYIDRMGGK